MNQITKWFDTVMIVLSMGFYIFDILSDGYVASQFRLAGDYGWFACSVTFIVLTWIFNIIASICLACSLGDARIAKNSEAQIRVILAICGLLPVHYEMLALKRLWMDGNPKEMPELLTFAKAVRTIEMIFEAIPQLSLQLYVKGFRNGFDNWIVVSIIFSFIAVTRGIVFGFVSILDFEDYLDTIKARCCFLGLFSTWVSLHLVSFLPPLAFYSSLSGHNSSAWMVFVVYFYFHLFISFLLSFWYNRREKNSYHRFCGFAGVIIQGVFFVASNLFTAGWMASVAPFVGNSTSPPTFYIWSETWLRQYMIDAHVTAAAAVENATFASENVTFAYDWATCSTDTTFCLTHHSPGLYTFFLVCSFCCFFYHLVLVIVWPWWSKKMIPSSADE